MTVYVCPYWAWLTKFPSSPVGFKTPISCIAWHTGFDTLLTALPPTETIRKPREEEDLVSNTYTYTKGACMHSNTASFVVNAFAPPHTIKVPIKGHYGFSTSSNHRESRSTAPALRARRCLLCCHPKELRLVHKPYDHNYWSKWKCHNNINSEDAIKKKSLSHSGKRGPSGTIRGKCLCDVYPVEERVLKWSSYWSHDS